MAARRQIDESVLVEAALSEFTTRGYEDASVNSIIEAAQISKGSFYYRFKTKYKLYLHLLKTGVGKKWAYINEHLESPDQTADLPRDIFDELLAQAKIGAEFAAENPEYHRLAIMFSREKGTALYKAAIRDMGLEDQSGLEGRIKKAVADGQIRKDFTEEFAARMVTHLLSSFDEMLFENSEWSLEKAIKDLESLVEFLRHGLAPRAPQTKA